MILRCCKKLSSWYTAYRPHFFILLVLLFSVYLALSENGLVELYRVRRAVGDIETDIGQMSSRNLKLKNDIHNFENNIIYVETLAREKLGLVKTGEIIYRDIDGTQK